MYKQNTPGLWPNGVLDNLLVKFHMFLTVGLSSSDRKQLCWGDDGDDGGDDDGDDDTTTRRR